MVNPYQAPQSDLGTEPTEHKSKKGWKAYFWFMALLHLLIVMTTLLDPPEDYRLYDGITDLIVYPGMILGIFGFAYNKPIISPTFWKIWIFITMASDSYSLSELFITETIDFEGTELYLFMAVLLAILLPLFFLQYLCLYSYAFKSSNIWNKK